MADISSHGTSADSSRGETAADSPRLTPLVREPQYHPQFSIFNIQFEYFCLVLFMRRLFVHQTIEKHIIFNILKLKSLIHQPKLNINVQMNIFEGLAQEI